VRVTHLNLPHDSSTDGTMDTEGRPLKVDELREPERTRIKNALQEADQIRLYAAGLATTQLKGKVAFRYEISAPTDVLSPFERAQSVCFVAKYDNLPDSTNLGLVEHDGHYFLANMNYIRHALNEYRPIVQNIDDSVHYSQIHSLCYSKLLTQDHSLGLKITALDESDNDITDNFTTVLGEHNRAAKAIIKACDFDYIYNGILQHSDHSYTKRFWEEYSSGRINYVFIRHFFVLDDIKRYLFWHYNILNAISSPKLGPL
jgi:hypothetical protein